MASAISSLMLNGQRKADDDLKIRVGLSALNLGA
jgi:hypothetical protein